MKYLLKVFPTVSNDLRVWWIIVAAITLLVFLVVDSFENYLYCLEGYIYTVVVFEVMSYIKNRSNK